MKDVSVFERFRRSVAKTLSTEEDVARQARDPRTEPKPTETDAVCSGDSNDSTDAILSGVGTVRIGLDAISFAALERQEKETNKRATLFLNGIDLGSDARRAGVYRTNERAYLTYQLTPGSNTGTLWRTLYAAGSIQEAHPLSVALGWDGIPARRNASVAAWTNDPTLAITTPPIFLTALVVMFVLIAASLALAWYGDALRDSKTPDFYREAMAQRAVARAKGASDAGLKALAAEYGVGDGTTLPDPGTVERWSTAAERAWTQEEPTSAEAIRAATLGAIFRSAPLGPAPRASYSLARVQLAVWFTFTVACALYLWIVFGTLPAISGSALALLGISIGTAAASVTIDQSHQGRPFKPSAGFFRDLTTGFDDKPHVYRYQAIVVNALLLLTGIYQVLDELKFPTFDSTWLAFLGLSGLTQAIGKQITDPPAGAPTAALAGAKPK